MLKIEDIQNRLQTNPEPKEVAEIRDRITNSFCRLEFVDPGHKYFLHREDGTAEELISVSKLCEQFEKKDDWDMIARRYANKHGMSVEQVQRMWRENNLRSTNNGTSTHLFAEMYMHFYMGHPENICDIIKPQYEDGFLIPYSQKQEAVLKLYEDLFNIPNIYPVMPETRVYTDCFKQNYAGTFDALFATFYQGEWCLLIYDWKTNKALESDFNRNKKRFLMPPFDDLIDEPQGHYTIQLSAYQIALENLGYRVIDRKLLWLKEDGNYEKRTVPDVTQKLREILG